MAPTDAMNRPAWQFWMDARIRAAGAAWENEQQQAAQSGGSTGAATDAERQNLVDDQEQRAARREQRNGQPGLEDQLAAFEDAGNG